jgi:hypothetical protein
MAGAFRNPVDQLFLGDRCHRFLDEFNMGQATDLMQV